MSDFTTQALYVFDEVYLSGYYLDSGGVDNYFVASFSPTTTVATAMTTSHKISVTGCSNIEMGPWVPHNASSLFMGVSIIMCSGIYSMLIQGYNTAFAPVKSIAFNTDYY